MKMITSTGGVEIALHRLGGRGPVLVLVHGNGLCGQMFSPLTAALARGFRCVAPDLRGHGDSVTPKDVTYDWDGFAEDVAAVVRAVDGSARRPRARRPVYALGHSMGGAAVLRAEELNPGLFTGIYCYEPVVMPVTATTPPDGAALLDGAPSDDGDDPIGARRLARIAYGRQHTFPSIVDAYATFASRPPFDAVESSALWAYVSHGFATLPDGSIRLKCPGVVEARIYQAAQFNRVFESLADVQCPVTVGLGEQSKAGPARFAPTIAAALPRGRLERFEALAHFGPLEAPELVAASISKAFATLP